MMVQESPKKMWKISDDFMRGNTFEVLFDQGIIPIGSIMKRYVVSLEYTKTAYDAAMLMMEKGVGCVVVTAHGKSFGMITERDIVCAVTGLKMPLGNLILSFLASRPLICAKPCQTVEEAADIMRKYNIRRLPIVDEDKIVGIVTARDIAIFLSPMSEARFVKTIPTLYDVTHLTCQLFTSV
jgi:CBS domain-containing protein